MCGIIACFNTKDKKGKKRKQAEDANKMIIDQYENQHSRGQKGFGIIRINPDQSIGIDRACEPTKFLLDLYMYKSPMIIAHHRHPTSTENWIDQTHPMLVSNPILAFDYLVIHNGIVSNDKALKEEHEKLGFNYTTAYNQEGYYKTPGIIEKFNDSETIAIEMVLVIEGKKDEVGTTSNAAVVALQIDKKTKKATKVFFGRNGIASDLKVSKKAGQLLISSEGEGEDCAANTLHSFKINDPKLKIKEELFAFKQFPTTTYVPRTITPEANQTKMGFNLPSGNEEKKEEDKEEMPDYFRGREDFVNNKYPEEAAEVFNEEAIGHKEPLALLDDTLDKEVTDIQNLIEEYKNACLEDFPNIQDMQTAIHQIATRMRAMYKIQECAQVEKEVYWEDVHEDSREDDSIYSTSSYTAEEIREMEHDAKKEMEGDLKEYIPQSTGDLETDAERMAEAFRTGHFGRDYEDFDGKIPKMV